MTLALLAALLLLSGVISGAETAVFSLRPAERRVLEARSRFTVAALARPGSLLVMLLLANLLVNVAYFSVSARMSLELRAGGQGVAALAVAVGSVMGLVILGEIVPKTLALVAPPQTVVRVAPLLVVLRWVLAPLVFLGFWATRLVEALFAPRGRRPRAVDARDFKSVLADRAAVGAYHAVELALLHDVVDFGSRRARNLMTPRVDVVFLDKRDDRHVWARTMARWPHRDYPVCDGSPDRLLGTVNAATILAHPETDPATLCEAPLLAPLNIGAERLVGRMRQTGSQLAVLLDEYGGVAGIVALPALTRAVLGEVAALGGGGRAPVVRRSGAGVVVRGTCPLELLEAETGAVLPSRRAGTVGGAVAEALGREPRRGDELHIPGWRLRVVDMRGRRVDRVALRPVRGAQP